MLDSIFKNWDDIVEIVTEKDEEERIAQIRPSLDILKIVHGLLEIFKQASVALEASNKPTLHLVYPHLKKIERSCTIVTQETVLISRLKEEMLNQITLTVYPNLSVLHKIAVFFLPPAKDLLFLSPGEKSHTINEIKMKMRAVITTDEVSSASQTSQTSPSSPSSSPSLPSSPTSSSSSSLSSSTLSETSTTTIPVPTTTTQIVEQQPAQTVDIMSGFVHLSAVSLSESESEEFVAI
jgi:hypothetical protein